MRDELCALLATAEHDAGRAVIVITAVDPVFTAGVDFKEVAQAGAARRGSARRAVLEQPGRGAARHDQAGHLRGERRLRLGRARDRAELHLHRRVGTGALRRHACPPGRGRDVGAHRAAAAGGRDPQGVRDVDHRQLRRRRRGVAHRPRQPRRAPRRPVAVDRAARRRHRHDRRGGGGAAPLPPRRRRVAGRRAALEAEHTRHRTFDPAAFGAAG